MARLVHVGIVVEDVEEAIADFASAFDLEFESVAARSVMGWSLETARSLGATPYLELLSGGAGSPWDAAGGPRLDHVAWYSEDLDADIERLRAQGTEVEIDFRPTGRAAYFRHPRSGLRFELLDRVVRPPRSGDDEPPQAEAR